MDELHINKEFAKKYERYRKAEEMQRLKDKYGNTDALESSSSESEDETAEGVNPKLEKDFFDTLAQLKRKDKTIYEKDRKFFKESPSPDEQSDGGSPDSGVHENSKSEKPFLLRDYERKVVLEKDGCYEDDENETTAGSYFSELNQIKKDLKKATSENDVNDDGGDDFLTKKAQSSHVDDKVDLGELDSYWKDPELSKDEKFLRDYILERKYLDTNELEMDGEYEEEEEEEEMFVSKQETFEHKFNFRYQEPDAEFIKSYPRTIGTSVRKTNNKTKQKRVSRKERKEEEKLKRMEELKRLKQLKREEILEKVNLLQKATGNTDINFLDKDIEGDFDVSEYDKRMKDLFDDEFYSKEEEEKPEFSDLGEDFDYEEDENWDEYECGETAQDTTDNTEQVLYNGLADCEQADFNMDCDYDSTSVRSRKKLVNPTKAEKKRKKSAFYEAVAKEKPKFNPDEKSFSEYLDEYYAMDFEDLIGDMPCRFKYRKVAENNFGLTTDEILNSDNRTLNSWCSLKQVVQHRSKHEEDFLQRKFSQLSKTKKRRHFEKFQKPPEAAVQEISGNTKDENDEPQKLKKNLNSKQRRRKREREKRLEALKSSGSGSSNTFVSSHKSKKNRTGESDTFRKISRIDHERLAAYGLKPKQVLKKAKYGRTAKQK
ncbi:protein KRI1 homolog [Ciona intestinalis]